MSTNPRGRYFLSYRRRPPARFRQAVRVRDALNDRGLLTWRDVEDLPSEPTEGQLRQALQDNDTAGAVMLVVPEIKDSPVIRKIEAPEIFGRHSKDDGFITKIALCGLTYSEADQVLESPAGFQSLGDWNLQKLAANRVTEADARGIARGVLAARFSAIRAHSAATETVVGFYLRRPDRAPRFDLNFDFTPYVEGRSVRPGTFERMQTGLHDAAAELLSSGMPTRVVAEGFASLPSALLFGAVFSPLARFDVVWRQALAGAAPEDWSLTVPPSNFATSARTTYGDPQSNSLVLAVGINQNIEQAVRTYLDTSGPRPRASLYVEPQGGRLAEGVALSPSEGTAVALQAITAVRNLRDELRLPTAEIHVFVACPLALAMLIGQKLNTFSACHVYEYDGDKSPPYVKMHVFNPSSFSYGR